MPANREAKEAHRRFQELLQALPQLQEHGSLALTAKNQITLSPQMREVANVDNLVHVWAAPELSLLVLAGQRRSPAEHLSFLVEPGD